MLAWSAPDDRAVAEDALLESGKRYPPLPPYFKIGGGGYGGYGGYGDGYGDGGYGGYGDGGYGGYGYGGDGYYGYGYGYGGGGDGDGYGGDGGGYGGGYGGGDGDGDGYGDGYGDGDGDGYGGIKKHNHLDRKDTFFMREGLCIVVSPGGYSPYVRVGWCRRIEGDEWVMVGARIIRRFGRDQQLVNLAREGPVTGKGAGIDTDLLDAATVPSPIHRLHAIRCEIADEKAWAKACPLPKDWAERMSPSEGNGHG